MPRYINTDSAVNVAKRVSPLSVVDFEKILDLVPTADVVEVKSIEQLKWERDTAIKQLQSYGVGLGENKELAEVKHGEWVQDQYINQECSSCGFEISDDASYELYYDCYRKPKFCPECGTKMNERGVNNA